MKKKFIYFVIVVDIFFSCILQCYKQTNINNNKYNVNHYKKMHSLNSNNKKIISYKSQLNTNSIINDTQNLISSYFRIKLSQVQERKTNVNLLVENETNTKIDVNYFKCDNKKPNDEEINGGLDKYINGNINSNKNGGVSLAKFSDIFLTSGGDKYNAYINNNHSSRLLTEKDIILYYNMALSKSIDNNAYFYIDIKNNNNITLNIKYNDLNNKIVNENIASYNNYNLSTDDRNIIIILGVLAFVMIFACTTYGIRYTCARISSGIIHDYLIGFSDNYNNVLNGSYFNPGENTFDDNLYLNRAAASETLEDSSSDFDNGESITINGNNTSNLDNINSSVPDKTNYSYDSDSENDSDDDDEDDDVVRGYNGLKRDNFTYSPYSETTTSNNNDINALNSTDVVNLYNKNYYKLVARFLSFNPYLNVINEDISFLSIYDLKSL